MGGGEVVFELNTLIDHAGWKKAWEQYCRLHTAPQDVIERDKATGTEGKRRPVRASGPALRLSLHVDEEPAYAKKAWAGVTGGPNRPRGGATRSPVCRVPTW